MNDTEVLVRYLYLGTDQPFYIRKNKPLDVEEGCRILAPIKILAEATAKPDQATGREAADAVSLKEEPVTTIVRVMQSGTLVRNDECLFTLAFMARNLKTQNERHKVYEVVPTLIESSKDLFMFVHFYRVHAKVPGFGNGMKAVIKKWYDKHSAEELASLLATDRGWHNWCHKDILKMARINLENIDKMQVLDAACGGNGRKKPPKPKAPKKRRAGKKPKPANEPIAEAAGADESMIEPPEPNVEEEPIADAAGGDEGRIEPPEPNVVEQQRAIAEQTDSEALLIYKRMKAFKSVKTSDEVIAGIQMYKYPLQLVPSQLQRAARVWENLFPHMPYRELVQVALVLQDYKLLKETDTETSRAYGKVLNFMKSVTESKVNPVYIYQVMRLFEEKQRYLNAVKEAVHTANNLSLKSTKANITVMRQFNAVLNQSLHNYRKTGKSFLVTLDLRSKQSKKRVFNNRLMSCQAAYILLTLPMFKKEQNITVLSFTEDPNKLVDVELTREMDFYKACDHIQAKADKKTKVSITQPILYATEQKKNVDVFITIVDSLIRVNPRRESPLSELEIYNRNRSKKARYIIVSLSRHQQDLQHMGSSEGVLELVGCSEETPKLINAYVEGHFK